MKTKQQTSANNDPIENKEEVQKSKDEHIGQDFPGYPHHPAKEDVINPKDREEHIVAGTEKKAQNNAREDDSSVQNKEEEIESDGSGNAFTGTEEVKE